MEFLRSISAWARVHRLRYTGIIAAVFVLQGVAVYGRLTSTTAISTEAALEEFHVRQSAVSASSAPVATGANQPVKSGQPGSQPAAPSAPVASAPVSKAGPAAAGPVCDWACVSSYTAPDPGVYEWFQCGRENGQCEGSGSEPEGSEAFGTISRALPRIGRRTVIIGAANKWTSYHQYAEEHKEEFDLTVDQSGVFGERYKVQVSFGPASGGTDIRQSPPSRFMQFPASLGLSWSGHWDDLNGQSNADYSGKIIDKQEITVSGKKIRTWVVEMKIKLLGPKSTGDALIRLWVAPEYRQTIQEFYDQSITDEHGFPYKGKWMITIADLKPKQ